MSDEMSIADYLARGGKLTAPHNAPPRYRAEILRLMAGFVDSELAGAAGFADVINQGPGVKERIAAARIVMEKTAHAGQVLELMGGFGANTARYANYHPWADRLERAAPVGAERVTGDMRLAVFNYPLEGWVDAVVMNLLMGEAVKVQLAEYVRMSYQPMAEAAREIAPRENHHRDLAEKGLERFTGEADQRDVISASIAYWWPRVSSSFGGDGSKRFETLKAMGLRFETNAALRAKWREGAAATLTRLGLSAPE